jgi:hypothetical protein
MRYRTCYICKILCEEGDFETFEGKHYCLSCAEFEFEGYFY